MNQVIEILLKYLETEDWKLSFFQVIPQRKRLEDDSREGNGEAEDEENPEKDGQSESKKKCVEAHSDC